MRSESSGPAPVLPVSPRASAVARAARALTGAEAAVLLRYEGDRPVPLAASPTGFDAAGVVSADTPLVPVAESGAAPRGAVLLHRPARAVDEALRSDLAALALPCLAAEDDASQAEALATLQRQLAHAERMSLLGGMVSGIVHEIRTPLTYIATNLYLLQRDVEAAGMGEAPARRVAETLDGVDRINHLLAELRRYARRDAAPGAKVALHEAVAEAVDLFRATRRGHLEVEASLEPTPAVPCDRRELQQVVLNLLTNAAEAMPRGGRIRVVTRPVDGGAELLVEDQGTGIPLEVQPRIFDEFYTTKPTGTGLGLPIVRRIVQERGGSIGFNTRPEEGTTFRVRMPAAKGF